MRRERDSLHSEGLRIHSQALLMNVELLLFLCRNPDLTGIIRVLNIGRRISFKLQPYRLIIACREKLCANIPTGFLKRFRHLTDTISFSASSACVSCASFLIAFNRCPKLNIFNIYISFQNSKQCALLCIFSITYLIKAVNITVGDRPLSQRLIF